MLSHRCLTNLLWRNKFSIYDTKSHCSVFRSAAVWVAESAHRGSGSTTLGNRALFTTPGRMIQVSHIWLSNCFDLFSKIDQFFSEKQSGTIIVIQFFAVDGICYENPSIRRAWMNICTLADSRHFSRGCNITEFRFTFGWILYLNSFGGRNVYSFLNLEFSD